MATWFVIMGFMEIMFQSYLNSPCMVCQYGSSPLLRIVFLITSYLVANLVQYNSDRVVN